jgi:hypothetical protein
VRSIADLSRPLSGVVFFLQCGKTDERPDRAGLIDESSLVKARSSGVLRCNVRRRRIRTGTSNDAHAVGVFLAAINHGFRVPNRNSRTGTRKPSAPRLPLPPGTSPLRATAFTQDARTQSRWQRSRAASPETVGDSRPISIGRREGCQRNNSTAILISPLTIRPCRMFSAPDARTAGAPCRLSSAIRRRSAGCACRPPPGDRCRWRRRCGTPGSWRRRRHAPRRRPPRRAER